MQAVINIVFPVFAIILTGYLSGRFRVLGEESSQALNRFVFYVAMPALLFHAMARLAPAEIFHLPFMLTYGGGQIIIFAATFLAARLIFRQNLTDGTMRSLASAYCNIGYIGLPMVIVAFGPDWTPAAVVATVINISVLLVGTITILEITQNRRSSSLKIALDVARGVFKNPQFLAPAMGIAWSFTGLDLPAPVATFTSVLGAAAGPCALFALGLFLVGKPLHQDLREVSWILVAKLLAQPLITWGLALWLLADEPMWLTLAVLLSAMPTGTTVFVFASKYDVYVRQASAAVMISTAISVLTLSALFVIWSDRILF